MAMKPTAYNTMRRKLLLNPPSLSERPAPGSPAYVARLGMLPRSTPCPLEGREPSGDDSRARAFHQADREAQVVLRQELQPQDLSLLHIVAQRASGEVRTCQAIALRVQGFRGAGMAGVLEVQ